MNSKNLFLKGIASNYLHFIIITIVGLWLTPFILQYLSKEEFGVFAIFLDIILWVKLIELTNGVLQSKLAQFFAVNDFHSANELILSGFFVQSCIAVLLLIISSVLSLNLDLVFEDPSKVPHLKEAFILVAVASTIDLIFQINTSILIALKRVYLDTLVNTIVFLLRVALIVLFLINGFDIMALAIANLITSVMSGILKYYRLKKLSLKISWKISYVSFEKISFMYNNGKWFTLGGLAGLMIFNIDRILTGKYLGLEYVTIYIITLKLFDYAEKFISRFMGILRPYLADLYAQKDYLKLKELYILIDQGYTLGMFAIGFFVLLLDDMFIHWWIGQGYYGGDNLAFFIFLNFSFQAMVMPKRALLASTLFEVKKQNIARLYEGIINLTFSLLLIHEFGLIGLLAASVIATLLGSNITYAFYTTKLFKDNGVQIKYSKIYWGLILAFLLSASFLMYEKSLQGPFGYLLIVLYSCAVGIYLWKYLSSNVYANLILEKLQIRKGSW